MTFEDSIMGKIHGIFLYIKVELLILIHVQYGYMSLNNIGLKY